MFFVLSIYIYTATCQYFAVETGSYTSESFSDVVRFPFGYLVAGGTGGFGLANHDMFIVRYNHHGDVDWANTYSETADLENAGAMRVYRTNDDKAVVFASGGWPTSKVWMTQINPKNGSVEWSRFCTGFLLCDVIHDPRNDTYVMMGGFSSADEVFVTMLSSEGDVIVSRRISLPGLGQVCFRSFKLCSDGNFFLFCTSGYDSGPAIFFVFNEKLDIQWILRVDDIYHTGGTGGFTRRSCVMADPLNNGTYIIAAWEPTISLYKMITMKINQSGVIYYKIIDHTSVRTYLHMHLSIEGMDFIGPHENQNDTVLLSLLHPSRFFVVLNITTGCVIQNWRNQNFKKHGWGGRIKRSGDSILHTGGTRGTIFTSTTSPFFAVMDNSARKTSMSDSYCEGTIDDGTWSQSTDAAVYYEYWLVPTVSDFSVTPRSASGFVVRDQRQEIQFYHIKHWYSCNEICFNATRDVCSSHGVCVDVPKNGSKCECTLPSPGVYYGDDCQYAKDFCNGIDWVWGNVTVCSGKGVCLYDKFRCSCVEGYHGTNCNFTECFGVLTNVSNSTGCGKGRGYCVDYNKCACKENYFGDECNVTMCFGKLSNDSSSCGNEGNCTDYNICECAREAKYDYHYGNMSCLVPSCSGINAEDTEKVCSSHGVCSGMENCTCSENYGGNNCQMWDCYGKLRNTSEACGSHGECTSHDHCKCVHTVYTGDECEEWECFGTSRTLSSLVCSGHGQCLDFNRCNCSNLFIGEKCDEFTCNEIGRFSVGTVCGVHGKCVDVNVCECEENYFNVSSIECDTWYCAGIPNRATGSSTVNSSLCSGRGNCTSHNSCTCEKGFKGLNCEGWDCGPGVIDKDSTATCSGHGKCTSPFSCICDGDSSQFYGFFGKFCEVKVGKKLVKATKNTLLAFFEVREDYLLQNYGIRIGETFECSKIFQVVNQHESKLFRNCTLSNMNQLTSLAGSTAFLKVDISHLYANSILLESIVSSNTILVEILGGNHPTFEFDIPHIRGKSDSGKKRRSSADESYYVADESFYSMFSYRFPNTETGKSNKPAEEAQLCKENLLISSECIQLYVCVKNVDDSTTAKFSHYSVGYGPGTYSDQFFFSKFYFSSQGDCDAGEFEMFKLFSLVSCYGSDSNQMGDNFMMYRNCKEKHTWNLWFDSSVIYYFTASVSPVLVFVVPIFLCFLCLCCVNFSIIYFCRLPVLCFCRTFCKIVKIMRKEKISPLQKPAQEESPSVSVDQKLEEMGDIPIQNTKQEEMEEERSEIIIENTKQKQKPLEAGEVKSISLEHDDLGEKSEEEEGGGRIDSEIGENAEDSGKEEEEEESVDFHKLLEWYGDIVDWLEVKEGGLESNSQVHDDGVKKGLSLSKSSSSVSFNSEYSEEFEEELRLLELEELEWIDSESDISVKMKLPEVTEEEKETIQLSEDEEDEEENYACGFPKEIEWCDGSEANRESKTVPSEKEEEKKIIFEEGTQSSSQSMEIGPTEEEKQSSSRMNLISSDSEVEIFSVERNSQDVSVLDEKEVLQYLDGNNSDSPSSDDSQESESSVSDSKEGRDQQLGSSVQNREGNNNPVKKEECSDSQSSSELEEDRSSEDELSDEETKQIIEFLGGDKEQRTEVCSKPASLCDRISCLFCCFWTHCKFHFCTIFCCCLPLRRMFLHGLFKGFIMVTLILTREAINLWFACSEFIDSSDIDRSNVNFILLVSVMDTTSYIIIVSIIIYVVFLLLGILWHSGRLIGNPFFLSIAYGALKEHLTYRLFKSVFMIWFMCLNTFSYFVKFGFLDSSLERSNQAGNFFFWMSFLIPELLLFSSVWDVLSYNGVSSQAHLKRIQRLTRCCNCCVNKFPKVKISFVDATKECDALLEDFFMVIFLIDERMITEESVGEEKQENIQIHCSAGVECRKCEKERVSKEKEKVGEKIQQLVERLSSSLEYGHLNWGVLDGMSGQEILYLRSFFFPSETKKDTYFSIVQHQRVASWKWLTVFLLFPVLCWKGL